MAGVASVIVTFISGGWNDGDPLREQAVLGMILFVVPPFGISMWINELQNDRKHNISRSAMSVPASDIVGVVSISVFGLIVFAGVLAAFTLLAFG